MVWWPVTGSTAVYSNRWGGAAVGNVHDAPTGLKLWHSIEPVVDWPNTPPEAVISPVHGPFAWKTSASVMVTSWGGVAAAGATSNIVVASDIAARSSSLLMIVLLSGAVRRLASVELYCPMTQIHYGYGQHPVKPFHRPALRPGNRGPDSRPHRVPRRGRRARSRRATPLRARPRGPTRRQRQHDPRRLRRARARRAGANAARRGHRRPGCAAH